MRGTGKWLAMVAALAVLAAGCGDDDDGGAGASDGGVATVKIGGMFDLSGPTADIGTPYSQGIEAFIDDWNANGKRPKIEITAADYKYDVAHAERLYSRVHTDGIVAVQGWGTGDTEALRGRVAADQLPFMSASYAAPLTDPGESPYNFVVGTSYSDQLRIALGWIAEQAEPGTQVAYAHNDSPFGESPVQDGEEKARELGLELRTYPMPAEATDYVAQLQRIKAQGARYLVVHNTSTPAAQLAKDVRQQGMDIEMICLNWCADELMLELAGEAGEGVRGIMPFAPASGEAEGLTEPVEFAKQQGNDADVHYVQGWYTMAVMAEGIRRAAESGEVTGESLKAELEEMPPFETGEVTGPIDFTADSHGGMPSSRIFLAKDGAWTEPTEFLEP